MRLTDASVSALKLPEGKTDFLVFDDDVPGFGVRLRGGGKRTWLVQYRSGVAQRRLSIGPVGTIGASEARKRARAALNAVHSGQDPQAAKAAARLPKAHELTLGEAVELYLPVAEGKLKSSTLYGVTLHLRKHWQPLHSHELAGVQRKHVAEQLARIKSTSGAYGANRSRAALSAFFSWAIGEGLADANAVAGTNKAIDERARERVLSDEELRLIWQHAGKGDYGAIVRLLILTGQRRDEVGALAWAEVDLAEAMWRIGGDRTKNSRAHDVPLSQPALDILTTRDRVPGRDLVFGSRNGPFSGWSRAKATLDKRLQDAGHALPDWRLHDLRRTAATRMADIGVQPHVVEAILNHVSGHKAGIAGVYNRSSYAVEKRAALMLWSDHVMALVERGE